MKQIMTKDDKAVSPIIATILLIAITVVLAATLVTILGGFTHGASGSASTAAASTQFSSTKSGTNDANTSVFLNVSSFSASNVSSSKIAITLTVTNSTGTGTFTYTGYLTSGASLTTTSSPANVKGPTYFTAGSDYTITIQSLQSGGWSPATSITVQLVYSGSVIYTSGTVT